MRENLIRKLEKTLIPQLLAEGFERRNLSAEDNKVEEMRTAFPHGYFRRDTGDAYDLLDIQFDPKGEPSFTLIASRVSKNGVDLPWGSHVPADEARAGDSTTSIELGDGRRGRKRFGPRLLSKDDDRTAQKIVESVLEKYTEVRDWFDSGSVGPHINMHEIK